MSISARIASSLGLTCLVAVSFAAVRSGAETQPFVVTSTLDGKTVLPHRILWRGVPALPAAQVARVESTDLVHFSLEGSAKAAAVAWAALKRVGFIPSTG